MRRSTLAMSEPRAARARKLGTLGARLTLLTLGAVWAGPGMAEQGNALLGERLRAHIEFLADDALAGRQPGTGGYDIAASYVASQYRQTGLQPAGDGLSYFQPVPLRRAWADDSAAVLELRQPGETLRWQAYEDYYQGPSLSHETSDITAPAVFVGYGIEAPELGHNDYRDLDLRGKVAVMLIGKPEEFPSEEGAHFGSTREKQLAAIRHGARGVVMIFTPRTERLYAWDKVRSQQGMPAMGWLNNAGEVPDSPAGLLGSVVLRHDAAGPLFAGSGLTVEQLVALDEAGEALPVAALHGTVHIAQRSRHEVIESANVAAVLPGSDPLLAGEYLIYTAHLDHLGVLAGHGHGDAINNGALDNASGVAVMLETARLLAEGPAPRRSVLFLAVTAEEKGLVGSGYFARNPTVPAERMVAVINLDMPVLLYEFGDVIAFGAEHSSLGTAAAAAAREAGIALTPDPFPEQNIFVRSDHYRFVQQGVPSLYLVTGPTVLDGASNALPVLESFLSEHYHMPSDDLALPINYNAAARFTRINTRIGELIANDTQRPLWLEGSFFGNTFAAP